MRTSQLLFMGLKRKCKQSEYLTWWVVPNVNIKHMLLPILYCGTVVEALHNAGQLPALPLVRHWPYIMQCLINSCFTKLFWGEIQCSPVSWSISYRGLCIVMRIVLWLCWWYTALNWLLLCSLLHPTTIHLNHLGIILVYICSGG